MTSTDTNNLLTLDPNEEGRSDHYDADDDDWRREMAMEAGMLGGINAYNEAMGCDLSDPDDFFDPFV